MLLGLVIGFLTGGTVGVFITALCKVSERNGGENNV